MHFLSISARTGQKHLEHFSKIWKDDYLFSLRKRSQVDKRHPRMQSKQEAWVGDVVQIQENTPRESWKIGPVIELIKRKDGAERGAKVLLRSRNTLQIVDSTDNCIAALLKSHFGKGILLQICCIFSEHLILRTPLDGCFYMQFIIHVIHYS